MTPPRLVKIKVLITMLVLSLFSAHAAEDIQECKEDKNVPMLSCLETKLKKTRVKYSSVSKLVAQQMVELDAATQRDEAARMYEASEHSFQQFVRKNCAWRAAASMGGLTGVQDQLACELQLIRLRLDELRMQLGH